MHRLNGFSLQQTTCHESGSKSAIKFAPLHIPSQHISVMVYDYYFILHNETQFDVMEILSTLRVYLYYQPFQYRISTDKILIVLLLPLFTIVFNSQLLCFTSTSPSNSQS